MARSNQKEGRELLRMRRTVGKAEQALAELDRILLIPDGICASDLGILERLTRKGAQPVNDLGRRIGLTSGSITTAVQRLRAKGLVDTLRGEKDRRTVSVSATASGKELADRLTKRRTGALETIFSAYSSRERELLQGLLKKVRKATEDYQQQTAAEPGGN